jgi:hypothetical protein
VPITTGIQFDANGVAALAERSNGDKTTSKLTEDTGLSSRAIPTSQWRFLDSGSIQLDLDIFNSNGVYEFQYIAEANHPSMAVTVLVELKSATTSPGLTSAVYSEVKCNQVVDGAMRYHKMRVTLSNVKDLRDIRMQSLLLKGLNMFGISGVVPILRP